MSKQAAEHDHKAAEHDEHAARHHREAAKHHEAAQPRNGSTPRTVSPRSPGTRDAPCGEAAKTHIEHHGKASPAHA
jgi:hypothetical protein